MYIINKNVFQEKTSLHFLLALIEMTQNQPREPTSKLLTWVLEICRYNAENDANFI